MKKKKRRERITEQSCFWVFTLRIYLHTNEMMYINGATIFLKANSWKHPKGVGSLNSKAFYAFILKKKKKFLIY